MKKILLKYILGFALTLSCLFNGELSFGQTVTITSKNSTVTNGITAGSLTFGQTNVVAFGFNVAVSGSSFTFNTIILNCDKSNYFTNARLYKSAAGATTYNLATSTLVASPGTLNTYISIPVTETIAAGTNYTYFLVADLTGTTTVGTVQFSFNQIIKTSPYTTYGSAFNGVNFSIVKPTVTVANLTSGLTTGTLTYGQTDIVIFGFSVAVTGGITSNKITIATATNAQSVFGSPNNTAKLFRSTTSSTYPTGFVQVATGAVTSGQTQFTYSDSFTASTPVYFFVTVDYTGSCPTPSTVQYTITAAQSTSFIIGPASATYPSINDISGTNFNIAKTLNWIGGNAGGLWSNLNNFATVCGGAPSGIGANDVIQIGVSSAITNQPVLTGTTTVGQIIFGKLNTPTLNTATFALNAGISTATSGAGGNPSITGAGAITMPSGSVSNIVSGIPLTIAGAVTNNTVMTVASGATLTLSSSLTNGSTGTVNDAGTITVSAASTNAGAINLTGTGALTYSNTLGNTGTITESGTGLFTVGGTLTNTKTISQSSSGNMSFAAITNNSGGAITFGSGTNSVSSTLGNASGATVTLGGTTTITGAVTNSGTLKGGAGTTTFTAAFTNSATTGTYNGGSANTTFNNTFTNNFSYTASTGINDFNNTFTNSGTATFPAGSGTTTMSGAFTNSASSTLTALAGTINFDNAGTQLITNSNTSTAVIFNNVIFSNTSVKTLAGSLGFIINGTTTFGGSASLTTTTAPVTNNGTFNSGAVTNTFGAAFTNGAAGTFNASTSTTAFNGTLANTGTFNPGTAALTFASSFTNNSGGIFTATGGSTTFSQGTAQAINNNNTTTPVTFYDMKLSGGAATKTLGGTGKFKISSTGSIAFTTTSTILAAGTAILTLSSDASGSSTVKALLTGNSITGTVNAERYLTGGASYSRGYRLLSSPVSVSSGSLIIPNLNYIKNAAYLSGTGGSTNGFDISGNPTLYFYRENLKPSSVNFTAGNYRGVSKINTGSSFTIDNDPGTFGLPAGNGFLFFFRGNRATNTTTSTTAIADPVTLTSTGYLNQGSITVNHWTGTPTAGKLLYTTTTGNTLIRGYNLVGNPYASSIDWDLVTKTNIGNTIYVYNPKLKVYATYVAGTNGQGTNFNGPTGTADIIPSGQGFFVVASNANAALTFTEANKVSSQVTSSTLSLASAADSLDVPRYLRVELFKDSLNKEDVLVFFKNNAQTIYSVNEDAQYLKGNSIVNISTRSSDNVNLAINQQAFPQKRQIIPLNVNITTNGIYKLNMPDIKNIPLMYDVWLLDNYKKDSLDIKNNPSYSFMASLTDTNSFGSKRFSLVLRPNPSLTVHLLNFTGTRTPTQVKLAWTAENESSYTRYILERSIDGGKNFNMLDSLTSANLGVYNDLDPNPVKGQNMYRLKQIDLTGNISYSSIVPIMYADNIVNNITANLISVYPNPVKSMLNLAITPATTAAANYKITITNTMGSIIKSSTSSTTNWQGDVSVLSPGTYFIQVVNIAGNTITGKSTFIKL